MKNKQEGETLAQREERVAKTIEHDEAAGIPPEQDIMTALEASELLNEDPTFIDKVDEASDRGFAEREATKTEGNS